MHKKLLNIFIVVATIIISSWYFFNYGKERYVLYGDAMGYYMYLPTTFIYHTHKALDWLPPDKHFDQSTWNYIKEIRATSPRTPKGYFINQYTYGVAMLEMPFFFIAHIYEKLTGKEANGYSATYQNLIRVSAIFYGILGLIFLYGTLRFFFSSTLSLLGACFVFIGSNLFWFTLCQAGMAHVPLFFLYALLMYLVVVVHNKPKAILFACIGTVAGLITLIRPTDILCLLIPLLYNVYNKETIAAKIKFIRTNISKIWLLVLFFILPIIPQLLYWKKFAGSYFYYSYGSQGFDWLHARIAEGLFSFGNGWLIYSPVMIFALLGLFFYRKFRSFAWCIYIILPLYIYIIYSWWCYNYINGLGSRPMIHIYPLLALPFTAFLQFISQRKLVLKTTLSIVLLFFVAINISYCVQKAKGILNSEESNGLYNKQMFFRMHMRYDDLVVLDNEEPQPDVTKIVRLGKLACENYEDSVSDHYVADPLHKNKYVYHMAMDDEYHPKSLHVPYDKQKFSDAKWIKCSGYFMCPLRCGYYKHLMTFEVKRGNEFIKWKSCKIDNKIGLADSSCKHKDFDIDHDDWGTWGPVYFYVKLPDDMRDGDIIRLDIWNIGKQEMYMDDICMELYK